MCLIKSEENFTEEETVDLEVCTDARRTPVTSGTRRPRPRPPAPGAPRARPDATETLLSWRPRPPPRTRLRAKPTDSMG